MWHVIVSNHDHCRLTERNTVSIWHVVILSVCHLNNEWDAFSDRCLDRERPKLSNPAHGTQQLQPRRSRRVRCSVHG
jgi:hypothetical protein